MKNNWPLLVICLIGLVACGQDYTPKPRGYMRIGLPEKTYHSIETDCPYVFETADYSEFKPDPTSGSEPCWFDISYPDLKAKLHFSYKSVNGNLSTYLEDSRELTNKHISQASNIEETMIIKDDTRVYGTLYFVEGSRAASSIQFHVTDSTDHFLRGALYFNVAPNNDSLAPVIDFLQEDIFHIIETLEWRS